MGSDLQRLLPGPSQYERARVPVALLFEPPLPERLGRCLTSRRRSYGAPAHESPLVQRERSLRKTIVACLARLNLQKRLLARLVLVEADTTQAQATLCLMEECYQIYNKIWEIYLYGLDIGRGNRLWDREPEVSVLPDQELLSRERFAAYLRSIGTQVEGHPARPRNGAPAAEVPSGSSSSAMNS